MSASSPDGGELVPSCNTAPPSWDQLSQRRRTNQLAGKTGTVSLNPFVALVSHFHCLLDNKFNGADELLVNIFRYLGPVEVAKLQRVSKDVRNAVKKTLGPLDIQDITSIFGFIEPKVANSIRDNPLLPIADFGGKFGRFGNNEIVNIVGFLRVEEMLYLRRVCKKWNEAVITLPIGYFLVDGPEKYITMIAAIQNLEQVILEYIGGGSERAEDEEERERAEDEEERERAEDEEEREYPFHDEEEWLMMTSSRDHELLRGRLYSLAISDMLGRYSVSFDFPHLKKLAISNCPYLEWDLSVLEVMPSLTELICIDNFSLTGNINDLRVLKETLERVIINNCCENVVGNFMDLADFPRLSELDLTGTAVSGDIQDIGENDFSALEVEKLHLPENVYGGHEFMFDTVSDVRDFFEGLESRVIRLLPDYYRCYLSERSSDWYPDFPFYVELVGGSWPGYIVGWRWTKGYNNACEVNWLDDVYIEDFEKIIRYSGFIDPPTREEYLQLSPTREANLW